MLNQQGQVASQNTQTRNRGVQPPRAKGTPEEEERMDAN
jgi:hypothetical protein